MGLMTPSGGPPFSFALELIMTDDFSLEDLDEGTEQAKTPTQIYADLVAFGELILTVTKADVLPLRQGLASAKYKANQRAKEAGLPTESASLLFSETPNKDIPGAIDVKVTLGRKGAIQILKTTLPDPEL